MIIVVHLSGLFNTHGQNPKLKCVCLFYEEQHMTCASITNSEGDYVQPLWAILHEKQQDELPLPTVEFN